MTTYTFIGNPNMQSVVWNDGTVWSSGDPLNPFPNSSTADVVIPEITKSDGSIYTSFITIQHAASYAANSVSLTDNDLIIDGTLSVTSAVDVKGGGEINLGVGTLSAGSLTVESAVSPGNGQIQGGGSINIAGTLTNDGTIVSGTDLIISAAAMTNLGTLTANSSTLTVGVNGGGFSNLSGTTLTGGTYVAQGGSGILDLSVGGEITTDAANIGIGSGGAINTFDSGSSQFVSIATTLTTIAQTGTLTLVDQTFNSNGLTDNGALNLNSATFNAPQLTVGSQGTVNGAGTIAAPVNNAGIIIAGFDPGEIVTPGTPQPQNNLLEITGAVSGTGVLEIGAPYAIFSGGRTNTFISATLQLDGPDSENVVFNNSIHGGGTLILNDLTDFTGAIEPESAGDNIILPNMSFSSVTGYSYAGNSSGGTLTIHETGNVTISLNFIGDLDTADFTLAAGPQPISSSPPSLEITVNPSPSPSFPPPNPAPPAGTSAFMVLNAPSNGNYEIYDIGNNSALAAYPLATIGTPWHPVALGNFSGADSTDLVVQNDNGQFQYYDVANNNVTASGVMGTVGTNWSVAGTGKFDSSNYTDIMMRQANGTTFAYDAFIVRNNQFTVANPIATVGANWQTVGFGDLNGDGTQDMVLQDTEGGPQNGTLEYYDIANEQTTSTGVLGRLGGGWQPVGFSNDTAGFSDLIMHNVNDGEYAWFEVRNNQFVPPSAGGEQLLAVVGAGWQPAGIADVNGDGTDDLVLQNTNTGVFEYYDIVNGHVTAEGELAKVGPEWTTVGLTPASSTARTSPNTTSASDPAPSSDNASQFMASDPGPSSLMASDPGPSSFMASDPVGTSGWLTQAMQTSGAGAPVSPQTAAADASLFADPNAGTTPLAFFGMPNPSQTHT